MTTKTAFSYSHTIGFLSNRYKGFQNPVDVAMDSQGLLYVINRVGPELTVRIPYKRITICTVDEEYLGEISTGGMNDGQMWWPSALAFDSDDKLYVADEALNRISIFTKDGEFLSQWGTPGSGPGQLDRPSGIAFDSSDNLLVTDSLNHRVQKFNRNGSFIGAWGEMGDGPGQFNMPWGITIDKSGDVYVADWRNDRIQKLDSNGKFIAQWGSSGEGEGQFNRPAAVAVDDDGNMYVADWGNERVQILDRQGQVLDILRGDSVDSTWADDYFQANPNEGAARLAADLEPVIDVPQELLRETSANVEKLFWGPTAVKLDDQGRVYIVDSCRHRLQIYRKS
jgi:DNA-binding beta-propeller fold protein YncE